MTGQPDPSRAELLRVLDSLEQRIDSAVNGVIRCIVGGIGWNGERTRRFRGDLERAVTELDAVTRALAMLDEMDLEIGGGE